VHPGPWNVLQSPLGIFHIQTSPSTVPSNRTLATGCHCSHWIKNKTIVDWFCLFVDWLMSFAFPFGRLLGVW
jgi:hypothetical protein